MANFCPGILYSIVWIILLWFLMWPIAGILGWIYILLLPFQACFPFLKDVCATLLKWMQYCETCGQNIKDMKDLSC